VNTRSNTAMAAMHDRVTLRRLATASLSSY